MFFLPYLFHGSDCLLCLLVVVFLGVVALPLSLPFLLSMFYSFANHLDCNFQVKPKVMKKAFREIGSVNEGHYIQVWDAFDGINKTFEEAKDDEKGYNDKLGCIKTLCSNLARKRYPKSVRT